MRMQEIGKNNNFGDINFFSQITHQTNHKQWKRNEKYLNILYMWYWIIMDLLNCCWFHPSSSFRYPSLVITEEYYGKLAKNSLEVIMDPFIQRLRHHLHKRHVLSLLPEKKKF